MSGRCTQACLSSCTPDASRQGQRLLVLVVNVMLGFGASSKALRLLDPLPMSSACLLSCSWQVGNLHKDSSVSLFEEVLERLGTVTAVSCLKF